MDIKQADIEKLFGVKYYQPGTPVHVSSDEHDMYRFDAYHGVNSVEVESGDCAFTVDEELSIASLIRGPVDFPSPHVTVVVRGYAPANKWASLEGGMILPYVNGCSTRQVFPPERPGDPTLQLLTIPPYSSEQAHHIHSTVRVVHVLKGRGFSVVGMNDMTIRQELLPGMTVVLEKMCPHHFETEGDALVVMPVHVWSAPPNGIENNHPMFNGTFLMNQGA